MPPSYCLSPIRTTKTPETFPLHNSNLFLLRYPSHSLSYESQTHFPRKDTLIFNPNPPLPKSPLLLLRLNNSKITHPFAALSSFADAEGDGGQEIKPKHQQEGAKTEEELPGMAKAFHISSATASAISICIAIAALTFPFFMKSLGQGLGLKTKLLSYATLLCGFYMAWNIGANDVANAMGTSVGSGALSLRQAVLTDCGSAGVFWRTVDGHSCEQYNAEGNSSYQCFSGEGYSAFCWFAFIFGSCGYLVAGAFQVLLFNTFFFFFTNNPEI